MFTLRIETPHGTKRVPVSRDLITIGRGETAFLAIDDEGLSRLHATIHRDGDRIWIVDENSTNGSFVNEREVPQTGAPLADGDEIRIGNDTVIVVEFGDGNNGHGRGRAAATARYTDDAEDYAEAHDDGYADAPASLAAADSVASNPLLSPMVLVPALAVVLLIMVGALGAILLSGAKDDTKQSSAQSEEQTEDDEEVAAESPAPNANDAASPVAQSNQTTEDDDSLPQSKTRTARPTGNIQQYKTMTPDEQMAFIKERSEHIAMMMGNRPYKFTPEALKIIKNYLDGYASRTNNKCFGVTVEKDCSNAAQAALSRQCLWGENLHTLYMRARCFAPMIIRAFNERGVPPVVGLYLPAIETEYHTCLYSPVGAGGLYQIMPDTARGYGMDPAHLCDAAKSTPAAAAYMRDRILEFGTHPMSVALGISGYNRNPESVKRDLRNVLNSGDNESKERSFWTLLTNSDQLDAPFRNENIKYVPKFFAAAIVGETPWAFGLDEFQPISTYTK